ncbi:MAG: transposase [Chloroflexi bacterium]|nr:transposase [Chloroflexota bacterium]
MKNAGNQTLSSVGLSPELSSARHALRRHTERFGVTTARVTGIRAAAASSIWCGCTYALTKLNNFTRRHSNGFAEGDNLKIKSINWRAFGYRNFNSFRHHVLTPFEPRYR